jgi:hypothetical protein
VTCKEGEEEEIIFQLSQDDDGATVLDRQAQNFKQLVFEILKYLSFQLIGQGLKKTLLSNKHLEERVL